MGCCAVAEIETRPLVEDDVEEVLALLERNLGRGPQARSREVWEWKHRQNPFGPSPGLVATAGGRIVGVRLFLRWCFRAGPELVPAVRAVDTATDAEWRGRGIFRRLTEELMAQMHQEGVGFVFNTPNRSSRPGYLKMGFRRVGRLRLMARPLAPWRWGGPSLPAEMRPIEELLAEPGLAPFLQAAVAGEERLHTPRSPEYLEWRYARAPGLDYRALWDFDDTSGALAIARVRRRGKLGELSLAEALASADAEGPRRLRRILGQLLGSARAHLAVACAAGGTAERRVLGSLGFLPLTVPTRWLTLRPLEDSIEARSWGDFRPQLGDLELF